jgi:hypothetical protein
MKKSVLVAVLCVVFGGVFALDIMEELNVAFKKGDYRTFSKYFANNVELNIPGNEGQFSKAQAEQILRDFFYKNQARDHSIAHQGESKDGARYTIGNLNTSNGNFRTYCHIKKQGDALKIYELRIEKE